LSRVAIGRVGVVMNAWDVYVAEEVSEDRIQREMEHLAHR